VNGVFKKEEEKTLTGQSKSILVFQPSLSYLAMNSRGRIGKIASAVAFWTTLVVTPSARQALTMYGKGRPPHGRLKWESPKERAAKEKGEKEKEKYTNETWEIENLSRRKLETMAFATIGQGETVTVNLDLIATSSMKDQKEERERTLPLRWWHPVNQN
jgi:hypothetical protein